MQSRNQESSYEFSFTDRLASRAVLVLSRALGMRNMTRPFWDRWRASLIGEETIMQFLKHIRNLEDWPQAALALVQQEERRLCEHEAEYTLADRVWALRRISYFCFIAQWGCLSITEEKCALYRRARDYYREAEQAAQGPHYRRIAVRWKGKRFWGNLHYPSTGGGPYPLIVLVHGVDDAKEEHLMTELAFQESGFAVFGFDGPGQAEALYFQGWTWPVNYHEAVSSAITALVEHHHCDSCRVALMGISWGGMWSLKTAAHDTRVRAVYDLGGPIDTRQFARLSFYLKMKLCQVTGVRAMRDFPAVESAFAIKDPALLSKISCPLRIVHGGRDGIVPAEDKEWLRQTLSTLHPEQDVTLCLHPTGDHCCSRQALEIRKDAIAFFKRVL